MPSFLPGLPSAPPSFPPLLPSPFPSPLPSPLPSLPSPNLAAPAGRLTLRLLGWGLLTCGLVACGPAPVPRVAHRAEPASPLGPSYVLNPLPSDDDALLGRVLMALPQEGRSLEETARPNPCADRLEAARTTPLAATFEDAEELAVGARARATLGAYGFSADAERATHFFYKMQTERRVARVDTPGYAECCQQKGCGYGYVSALIYGDGEYASAEELQASGSVDVAVATAGGTARLKVLHQRKVRGWMAALVTVTDPAKARELGPLGVAEAAGIKVEERSVPEAVKAHFEESKISVIEPNVVSKFLLGSGWYFTEGETKLTENEFVRRYRAATGSDELDDLDRRRNWAGVLTTGALSGLSLAGVVWGAGNTKDSQGKAQPGADVVTGLGVIGMLVFTPIFVWKLSDGDGTYGEHSLKKNDAELYAQSYNRSMLRESVKTVQKKLTPTSLRVELRPGGLGLSGTF